jgi:hypothetical protein
MEGLGMQVMGKALAIALAACAMAGCGKTPTAVSALRTAPVEAPLPIQTPASAANPQATELAAKIIAAVAAAKPRTTTWVAKAHSTVTAPNGDTNWNVSEIHFRAPSTMAAHVISAKDGKTMNTSLVYRGGDEIDLKTYFFGFIAIKISLPINDSRLQDAYHRTLKDTQTSQLMGLILDPNAKATYLGAGKIFNQDVDFLDIVSPSDWKDVSHEVVGISRTMACPLSRDAYDKRGKRMFQLQLENMRINYKPGSDDFTL